MTEDAYKGVLLASKIKMNTVINVVCSQTIPVKKDG